MITILDYGVGNIGSIYNMLRKIGASAVVTSDVAAIRDASKLILPGIGHFDAVMNTFNRAGIRPAVEEAVLGRQIPILGICVGMQMMMADSEEGTEKGLGWVQGRVRRFDFTKFAAPLRLPHIGWNHVQAAKRHSVIGALPENSRFYFVHSYHAVCDEPADVLLRANYGIDFTAAFAARNMIGVQFHPEKSHRYGMQLLRGFAGVAEKKREVLSII